MSIISAYQSALSGIRSATMQTEKAAKGISRLAMHQSDEKLVQDVVDLKSAKLALSANVSVIKAADEMDKQLIDTFA